jgi:hypothetical protein
METAMTGATDVRTTLLLLPQMGGAIALWVLGIINCVVILILMAGVGFVAKRTNRGVAFCVAGWVTILVIVYCTRYVPYLDEVVFDPIASLGWLM